MLIPVIMAGGSGSRLCHYFARYLPIYFVIIRVGIISVIKYQ